MEILVIDGQGGGLGRQLVAAVKKAVPQAVVTAIGTNSAATSAMLKAGADRAATGENAVVVGCRRADVILGPIGIVMADALLGEITPAMAQAVAQSDARRILIPCQPVRYPGGWGERPHRHPGGAGRRGRAGRLPELRQHRIKTPQKAKCRKYPVPLLGNTIPSAYLSSKQYQVFICHTVQHAPGCWALLRRRAGFLPVD